MSVSVSFLLREDTLSEPRPLLTLKGKDLFENVLSFFFQGDVGVSVKFFSFL